MSDSSVSILDPIVHDFASYAPAAQEAMSVSKWFATETMEVEVGESVGRPSRDVKLSRDVVTYLLANGWYITAFLESSESGEWTSVSESEATNSSGSVSNGWSKSSTRPGGEKTLTAHLIGGTTQDIRVVPTPSSSDTQSNGSNTVAGASTSKVTNHGAPYWHAFFKVRLQRRRIQAESVLEDMVKSFTDAYNEGRQVNSDRYDEIVSLYALMLARTESEANAVFSSLSPDDFKPLAKAVTDAVKKALEDYKAAVGDLPSEWMQSRIDEINRKFDALLTSTQSELVTKGLYNATVWTAAQSGIERDRQSALNDLKDDMVTLKIEAYGRIATITADVGQKLLDCEIRIIEAMQKMLVGPTELRNTVLKWMLDFMERRDDDHPSLESLVTVADKLGYAEGAPAASIAS